MPQTTAPQSPDAPVGVLLRIAALTYDGLLLIAIYFITTAIVSMGSLATAARQHDWASVPDWYRHFVLTPSLFFVTYMFYGYFWRKHGQTLGMQTWRLQALRADGNKMSWGNGLSRMLAALLLPALCGSIAWLILGDLAAGLSTLLGFFCNYFWIYNNTGRLALHDQLSGTRVWRVAPKPKQK
jgi:uncharacterized RDD family membrane protein YckC